MKKLILALMLIAPLVSFSQDKLDSALRVIPYNTNGNIVYEKITPTKLSISEQILSAKKWLTKYAGKYNAIEASTILANWSMGAVPLGTEDKNIVLFLENCDFSIELTFKAGKFRTRISEIVVKGGNDSIGDSLENRIKEQKNRTDENKGNAVKVILGYNRAMLNVLKAITEGINVKPDSF